MTHIDFYILASNSQQQRLDFVCRWVQKAYRNRRSVYIAVDTDQQVNYLDTLLWRFTPDSFLPHDCDGQEVSHAAVRIGLGEDFGEFHDCLLNLRADIPPNFSCFERLAEVVCQEERILEQTRAHYSYYRDRYHPIETHRLPAAPLAV